ncbi:arginase [Halocatena salina]|uniref:Arginase n=1 Tax=Halocatena salina TaxID=2934340 RepID=A0A8U0A0A9_9EURY|nr:arginase [Halocatena salina]UPM42199.1 arginase [Halocatena salina]
MPRPIRAIGVPMDLGADRRGVDMGPSALRYAGLADALTDLDYSYTDTGDLDVTHPELGNPDSVEPSTGRAKYLAEIRELCVDLEATVAETIAEGAVPLVLGGDHSIAIGSVRGSARTGDIGMVWFDAHGDFNTPETTPSGNVHGMPLAAVLGHGSFATLDWAPASIDPENVALVGIRNLDDDERKALRDSGVTIFTMSDIDERGATAVTEEALSIADAPDGIHVSLDLDWLDPREAPGVGTPVRGGVTYREAHAAMETIEETNLRSIELVEVNPILDDHNQTAELAVELVTSALGKTIL